MKEKVVALCCVAWATAAGAETLVHYHLDDLAVGTRGTASTEFVNAADPGTLNGKAVTFNGKTQDDLSALYPVGANGLPEAWRYFDPVGNVSHEANKALRVAFASASANTRGGGVSAGPVVLSSFTVETFFRYENLWGDASSSQVIWQTLLYKASSDAARALEVRIKQNDGRLWVMAGTNSLWSAAKTCNDGQWHHVACAYDSGSRVFRLYVDYKLDKTLTLAEDVTLAGESESFYLGLGGPAASWQATFTGDLAEFRVSDAVLSPAQFIRAERGATLAWLAPGVAADPVPDYSQPDLSHSTYTLSDDADGATLYDGALDATGVEGRKSYAFSGDSGAGGFVVVDARQTFAVSSFTAEIGFKYPKEAWKDFTKDCVYLFSQKGAWYVRCMKSDGRILLQDSSWTTVATIYATAWDDGAWHRLAVVSDRENQETRVYLDGLLVKRATGVLGGTGTSSEQNIYVNCGCWGSYTDYSCKVGNLNDVRLTRAALKPSEFLMTRHVSDTTLVWAPFDGKSDALAEAVVETPSLSGAATLVGANAGEIRDADGNRLRERNGGSLSLATGSGAYSRLSLLERPDQTVELFLRGSADAGTDLVSLKGVTGGVTSAIWSLRQTEAGLKVVVAGAEVASAGELTSAWSHVAVVFAPAADGETTAVTVYRDYKVAGTGTFSGTLAVDGLSDSSLAFGAFAGNVDEVRVSRGARAAADFLRAHRLGLALIVR